MSIVIPLTLALWSCPGAFLGDSCRPRNRSGEPCPAGPAALSAWMPGDGLRRGAVGVRHRRGRLVSRRGAARRGTIRRTLGAPPRCPARVRARSGAPIWPSQVRRAGGMAGVPTSRDRTCQGAIPARHGRDIPTSSTTTTPAPKQRSNKAPGRPFRETCGRGRLTWQVDCLPPTTRRFLTGTGSGRARWTGT